MSAKREPCFPTVIAAVSAKAKPLEAAMAFRVYISLMVATSVGYTFLYSHFIRFMIILILFAVQLVDLQTAFAGA